MSRNRKLKVHSLKSKTYTFCGKYVPNLKGEVGTDPCMHCRRNVEKARRAAAARPKTLGSLRRKK